MDCAKRCTVSVCAPCVLLTCNGGHDLPDESVEVGVARSLYVQVPPADVVYGLVIDHEGAVRVRHRRVRRQDRVVRLHHRCRHLVARKEEVQSRPGVSRGCVCGSCVCDGCACVCVVCVCRVCRVCLCVCRACVCVW